MADEIKKVVLLDVQTNTGETNNELESLRKKLDTTIGTASKMSKVDYGTMSVKELREELLKAEQSMEQLADSGQATAGALGAIENRVDDINTALKGIDGKKAFDSVVGGLRTATGAVGTLEGAMGLLGIQNKEFEEYITRLGALQAFRGGIEDLKDGMEALGIGFGQANNGAKLLKVGLSSLGIGLVITAVSYLVEYWDEISEKFRETFPQIEGLTERFGNFKAILITVGQTVVGTILPVIQSLIEAVKGGVTGFKQLFSGDFAGAAKSFGEAFVNSNPIKLIAEATKGAVEGVKNFGVNLDANTRKLEENAAKAEEVTKKTSEAVKTASKEVVDTTKEELDKLEQYISDAERRIYEAGTERRTVELEDIRAKYAEQIALAQKHNEDTTALLEAQRLAEKEVNDKYDAIAAEDALKQEQTIRDLKAELLAEQNNGIDTSTPEGLMAKYEADRELRLQQYEIELEDLKNQLEQEAITKEEYDLRKKLSHQKYTNDVNALDKESNEQRRQWEEITTKAKLDLASNAFGAIAQLAGEASAVGKAAAIAQTTIDTYSSATAAYSAMAGIPIVGPALGAVAAGVAVAAGLANVKKILAVKKDSKSAPSPTVVPKPNYSGAIAEQNSAIAPVINTTQLEDAEPDDINDVRRRSAPIRAYIVDRDLQDNQNNRDMTDRLSTF